jgi:GTPase SAR1 family protein
VLTAKTMAEGRLALSALITWIESQESSVRNEAQTRFDIIDRLILECFGWTRDGKTKIRVETYQRGEFSDYELGSPRSVIWEAKREGTAFDLPPGAGRNPLQDLPSMLQRCKDTKQAIDQAQGYAASRGVELAVVTNGHQLICSLATRNDGVAPLDGMSFTVDSLTQLDANFATAWDLLSPDGVFERRYLRILRQGTQQNIPPKLSSALQLYPKHKYASPLQTNLRTLAELLIQDIGETEAEEKQFYKHCYCSSGALSQHALLTKTILEARYAALMDSANLNALSESVNPKRNEQGSITNSVLEEALSRRPVILIGDVGVGKTSFLKHLIIEGAKQVFENAIYIYVNLGSTGTMRSNAKEILLKETKQQLYKRYGIDIDEHSFLKGAYASEIDRFRRGAYAELFKADEPKARERLAEMLHTLTQDESGHIQRSIEHLSKGRHKQVIMILDNADQRSDEVQQNAFLISQELARTWSCYVFIALRPATFYRSRTSGVLAAYPHRVFTILPPRIDEFLEKRLTYALDMAEGRISLDRLSGIQLNIGSVATVIKALLISLKGQDELQEFLANITGGNVRELLQFITSFIGSTNVNAEKIVTLMRGRSYRIPLHEFSKAALLGDFAHYHAPSSLAVNVFDVGIADPREHFLLPLILSFIDFDGDHKDKDGFVSTESVTAEMQTHGFTLSQIEGAIKRAINGKLIELPNRMLIEDDAEPLFIHGDKNRLTAKGAYHLKRWLPTFAYLDAMVFDTPVFDASLRDELIPDLESFAIRSRFQRASLFKSYLQRQWREAGFKVQYFDFETLLSKGNQSFAGVQRATGLDAGH